MPAPHLSPDTCFIKSHDVHAANKKIRIVEKIFFTVVFSTMYLQEHKRPFLSYMLLTSYDTLSFTSQKS